MRYKIRNRKPYSTGIVLRDGGIVKMEVGEEREVEIEGELVADSKIRGEPGKYKREEIHIYEDEVFEVTEVTENKESTNESKGEGVKEVRKATVRRVVK